MPVLTGCGAGVIIGALAGNGQSPPPPPPVPSVALAEPQAPLVGPPLPGRVIFVNNFQVPTTGTLSIQLRSGSVTSDQGTPVLVSADPSSSTIGFFEQHAEILAPITDPTAADVATDLLLYVDQQPVGAPVPFTLIRQRVATLLASSGGTAFVSVLGNSRLQLRVSGRANETKPAGLLLEVGVPGGTPQSITDATATLIPGTSDWLVEGTVPQSLHLTRLFARSVDSLAGFSTIVGSVYYRPAIVAVAPASGSIEGNTLTTAFGQGLAPLSTAGDPNSPPAFGKIQLRFDKGGRTLTVQGSQMRPQSTFRQLVFSGPQSPDGRPGMATLTLEAEVESVQVTEQAAGGFVYRLQSPSFGPRGAWLPAAPRQLRVIRDLEATGRQSLDAVVLGVVGGLPSIEILLSQDNGMLSSFGPALLSADLSDPRQRSPAGVCAGDYDSDGITDLVIANSGSVTAGAQHTIVLGQAAPKPPLSLAPVTIADAAGANQCLEADFDSDGRMDALVLPDSNVQAPRLLLARAATPGQPRFDVIPLGGALAQNGPYDATAVRDFDGDGAMDIVAGRGGTAMSLIIAYGDGQGGISAERTMTVSVPGYTPDGAARLVLLDAAPLGSTNPAVRPLVVVLAGLANSLTTPPAVTVLQPISARDYDQPQPAATLLFPGEEGFVAAAIGDLDGQTGEELVVAAADDSSPPLRVFAWGGNAYAEVVNAVPDPLEPISQVSALHIGKVVPAASPPIYGVLVQHELRDAGGIEQRVSAWLATGGLNLVAPDGSLKLAQPIYGAALGAFTSLGWPPPGTAQDLAIATASGVEFLANDGVGNLTSRDSVVHAGVVGTTLTAVPLGQGQVGAAAAFLDSDGRLGLWWLGGTVVLSPDLRQYASEQAEEWDVLPGSRILADDVDGDGRLDLAVVLALQDPITPIQVETVVVLLRGDGSLPPELPFFLPAVGSTLNEELEATGSVLADFVKGTSPPQLELALAFPETSVGGRVSNAVAFYRYDAGSASLSDDRFIPSSTNASRPVLIAGDKPTQVAASDLDRNGTTDLVVASAGDRQLHLFLNIGNAGTEVDIDAFVESQNRPALTPGTPSALLLGDLDGDSIDDVIATSLDDMAGQQDWQVGCYISSGTGALNTLRLLPGVRTGNQLADSSGTRLRDADMVPAMADLNRDGFPDLVFAWAQGAGVRNVHLMFGAAR